VYARPYWRERFERRDYYEHRDHFNRDRHDRDWR
jgi:hypothetical protein